jgi:hypothetical protein
MRFHQAISVLTLIAFLPLAFGCSITRTASVSKSSQVGRDGRHVVEFAEPIEIQGYTDRSEQYHEWKGTVQAAGLDSLQFSRQLGPPRSARGYANAPPTVELEQRNAEESEMMWLARTEVLAIHRRELSGPRTFWLVLGVGVALLVVGFFASGGVDVVGDGSDWEGFDPTL